ncbi:MAG: hypothetical protein U1E20_10460 [Methylocystis sp.]|uniref:hypothetical protein n=1 Tax=Methylocystis sp. TaxID=1911079 RepID=UPI003956A1F0
MKLMAMDALRSFLCALALTVLDVPVHAAGGPANLNLTCSGNSYSHDNPFPTPETVSLSVSGPNGVSILLGGSGSGKPEAARVLSNNEIQLKFAAGLFTGEYFHLTRDLFLIHKDGRLTKLTCSPN